jgi:hypothetical protein
MYSESVKSADFARVMREYAEKGYRLITGDAFGAERIARRVARDYPDVAFVFGSGIGPAEPNFGVFDNWIHEPAYLSRHDRRKDDQTNIIGVVAAMPIPEVNRLSNAFYAGAKEVNKDVKCKFSFIGSFFDPPKAKEAALAQIEAGVDVIYAERFGVIEAAVEKGVLAISNMSDQSSLGPDTVITGPVWDMWPTVKHVPSAWSRPACSPPRISAGSLSCPRAAPTWRPTTNGKRSCRPRSKRWWKSAPRRFWTAPSGWTLMNPSPNPIRSCLKKIFQPNIGVGSTQSSTYFTYACGSKRGSALRAGIPASGKYPPRNGIFRLLTGAQRAEKNNPLCPSASSPSAGEYKYGNEMEAACTINRRCWKCAASPSASAMSRPTTAST